MQAITNTLLYVADPIASTPRFAAMLGRQPVHSEPGFVLFALGEGVQLSLWRAADAKPGGEVGGSEIGFQLNDRAAVDALHADWVAEGITILQPPVDLGFGRSFVATGPDGHRIRVYARAGA